MLAELVFYSSWIPTITWFFCTDCYHGIISYHRPLLPWEFWQHCAPLHDSEGAVKSSGQKGITAALATGTSPPSSSTPSIPSSSLYKCTTVGGGKRPSFECISDVNLSVADVYSLLVQWCNSSIDFTVVFIFPLRVFQWLFHLMCPPSFLCGSSFTLSKWGQTKHPPSGFKVGRLCKPLALQISDFPACARKINRKPVWPVFQNMAWIYFLPEAIVKTRMVMLSFLSYCFMYLQIRLPFFF